MNEFKRGDMVEVFLENTGKWEGAIFIYDTNQFPKNRFGVVPDRSNQILYFYEDKVRKPPKRVKIMMRPLVHVDGTFICQHEADLVPTFWRQAGPVFAHEFEVQSE